jgi:Xaa-Pro aminopeptidase
LVDSTNTTIDQYNNFIKPFSDKIVEFDATYLRIVKTPHEIKMLEKAADIVCNAILYIQRNIKIGMTEIEVADKLAKHMFANGASALSFPPIVTFGKNTTVIHSAPSASKLQPNQMILVDAGCVYKNYCSDITRC